MNLELTSLPNSLQQQVYRSRVERARQKTLEDRPKPPAYDNLSEYKKALYKRYIHPDHLELLDRELEKVTLFIETGGEQGTWMLIVSMPPRVGKTLTVSKLYPTWHLGRNPDHRVMLTSYGASLAYKSSRFARSMMKTIAYHNLFGIALDPGSRAVDAWDIDEHEGGTDALGVQGGATGKGAHLLVLDDLLKNRQEAESETIRQSTWDAVNDDLITRLEPGGAVVLMATRWHEDDPTGRMIKLIQNPDVCNGPVVILNLVAMPETDEEVTQDPLHRSMFESIWPERYTTRVLKATRDRLGPYSWGALYKGKPTPHEGGLFKRANFNRIREANPAEFVKVVRFWDLAMSEKTSADYTVGVKMAKTKAGRFVILDVARKQLDWE